MCNCQTWARLPQQGTHDSKYLPPSHHPDCEDFKLMEPQEAAAMIADGDCQYNVTPVMLTRDQFERMGEFAGF